MRRWKMLLPGILHVFLLKTRIEFLDETRTLDQASAITRVSVLLRQRIKMKIYVP